MLINERMARILGDLGAEPAAGFTMIEAEGAEGGGGDADAGSASDDESADGDVDEADDSDNDAGDDDGEAGESAEVSGDDSDDADETPAQRRARRRAELAKDRDVLKLIAAQSKKAVREALAAQAAEEKKKAEMAAKTESERLAAEKAEAEEKAQKAEAERDSMALNLAFYKAAATTGLKLRDPDDLPFVQQAAAKAMEDDGIDDWEEALTEVANAKPHWFEPTAEEAKKAEAERKAKAKAKATTTAKGSSKGTEKTAKTDKTEPKSAFALSDDGWERKKQELGFLQ